MDTRAQRQDDPRGTVAPGRPDQPHQHEDADVPERWFSDRYLDDNWSAEVGRDPTTETYQDAPMTRAGFSWPPQVSARVRATRDLQDHPPVAVGTFGEVVAIDPRDPPRFVSVRWEGQETGPADSVMVLKQDFDSGAVEVVTLRSAGSNTSMLAFILPDDVAREVERQVRDVVGDEAEQWNRLHVTLCCFDTPPDQDGADLVIEIARRVCREYGPVTLRSTGIGQFESSDGVYPTVLTMTGNGLAALRTDLVRALRDEGVPVRETYDLLPHLTVAYVSEQGLTLAPPTAEWTADRLDVVIGDAMDDGTVEQVELPGEPRTAEHAGYDAESKTIRENAKTVGSTPHQFKPAEWTTKNGHPRCLLCGDEETISGQCSGATRTAQQDFSAIVQAASWDVEQAARDLSRFDFIAVFCARKTRTKADREAVNGMYVKPSAGGWIYGFAGMPEPSTPYPVDSAALYDMIRRTDLNFYARQADDFRVDVHLGRAAQRALSCPSCGGALKRRTTNCPYCGVMLVGWPQEPCFVCGRPSLAGGETCQKCGEWLVQVKERSPELSDEQALQVLQRLYREARTHRAGVPAAGLRRLLGQLGIIEIDAVDSGEWWSGLTHDQQVQYLEDHPGSKLRPTREDEPGTPDAPAPLAGPDGADPETYRKRVDQVAAEHLAAMPEGLDAAIEDLRQNIDQFPIAYTSQGDVRSQDLIDTLESWRPPPLPPGPRQRVHHTTDRATAERIVRDGVIPQIKPWTLASERWESGEDTTYAPGAGASRGLYVGEPGATESYGRVTLELAIPPDYLEVPPELSSRGYQDAQQALKMHDGAVITKPIPPEAIRIIGSLLASLEVTADWWDDMSFQEQTRYKREHPRTKRQPDPKKPDSGVYHGPGDEPAETKAPPPTPKRKQPAKPKRKPKKAPEPAPAVEPTTEPVSRVPGPPAEPEPPEPPAETKAPAPDEPPSEKEVPEPEPAEPAGPPATPAPPRATGGLVGQANQIADGLERNLGEALDDIKQLADRLEGNVREAIDTSVEGIRQVGAEVRRLAGAPGRALQKAASGLASRLRNLGKGLWGLLGEAAGPPVQRFRRVIDGAADWLDGIAHGLEVKLDEVLFGKSERPAPTPRVQPEPERPKKPAGPGFLTRVTQAGGQLAEQVKRLPGEARRLFNDPQYRAEVGRQAGLAVRRKANAMVNGLVEELRDYRNAGATIAKMSRGERLTDEDKRFISKAVSSAASTVAGAIALGGIGHLTATALATHWAVEAVAKQGGRAALFAGRHAQRDDGVEAFLTKMVELIAGSAEQFGQVDDDDLANLLRGMSAMHTTTLLAGLGIMADGQEADFQEGDEVKLADTIMGLREGDVGKVVGVQGYMVGVEFNDYPQAPLWLDKELVQKVQGDDEEGEGAEGGGAGESGGVPTPVAAARRLLAGIGAVGYVDERGWERGSDGVREHRRVMEEKLDRPLKSSEDVHHIDEDKSNNQPSNLEVVDHADHTREHKSKAALVLAQLGITADWWSDKSYGEQVKYVQKNPGTSKKVTKQPGETGVDRKFTPPEPSHDVPVEKQEIGQELARYFADYTDGPIADRIAKLADEFGGLDYPLISGDVKPSPEELAVLKQGVDGYLPAFEAVADFLSSVAGEGEVIGRLKSPDSVWDKLRKRSQEKGRAVQFDELTDHAGTRLSYGDAEGPAAALQAIQAKLPFVGTAGTEDGIMEVEDFSTDAKPPLGYRAIHLLVRQAGKPVEVQLRTTRQTVFADYAHNKLYKAPRGIGKSPAVQQYATAISDYLAALDRGQQPTVEPPACPPVLQTMRHCFPEGALR